MSDSVIHYVIPKGIDTPLEFILWNARHCTVATVFVSFMMYLDQLTLGLIFGFLILYLLNRFERQAARGAAMHALWSLGLPVGLKGLKSFPSSLIKQFTQ
jgi:hypothetical protein